MKQKYAKYTLRAVMGYEPYSQETKPAYLSAYVDEELSKLDKTPDRFQLELNEQQEEMLLRNHPYIARIMQRAIWQNYYGGAR